MRNKLICALDTGNREEAIELVRRLSPYVGAFKIGHALTLPYGLAIIDTLREFGADRIFLDLKFHDIPNSVALAVREAAQHGVWMLTLHLSGGAAMISAAVEEARMYSHREAPKLIGVSVLTSIDQRILEQDMGVTRKLDDHMMHLSKMGCDMGLDGVVSSVEELKVIRPVVGRGIIVTPGIRPPAGDVQDQRRVGDAQTAIANGADYLVIGRALTTADEPERALTSLGVTL